MSDDIPVAVPASDLARPYPPASAPAGFAKDGRPENPRPYASGAELASPANAHKAHPGNASLAR